MIAFVQGRVAALTGETAVIEVGGFGVALLCTPPTLAKLRPGESVRLATALVVREDSLTLFGFLDDDERATFELVQTASGIGPKVAQAMLAVHSPAALQRAVVTEDLAALCLVPGIGKKGAQRIVLELKDKFAAARFAAGAVTVPSAGGPSWRDSLHAALLGLGWAPREADEALTAVGPMAEEMASTGGAPDIAVLLRTALQTLSRT